MQDVNIYIEIRIKGFKAPKGYYSYVLEALDCDGKPKEDGTRQGFGEVEDATELKLTLTALNTALKRFTKSCSVRVITECDKFLNPLKNGWFYEWKKNNWKKANGKPPAHVKLWKEFSKLSENHLCAYEKGTHEYRVWQQREIKKMEQSRQ